MSERIPFPAPVPQDQLDRQQAAIVGGLLNASVDAAKDALSRLMPGDLADERLAAVARAAWHVVQAGERPLPTAVAEAAKRHGIVSPGHLPAFGLHCADLYGVDYAPAAAGELVRLPSLIDGPCAAARALRP